MRKLLPTLVLLLHGCAFAQPALIPWPQEVEWREGCFPLQEVTVVGEPGLEDGAAPLRDHLLEIHALALNAERITRAVHVKRDTLLPREGYTLTVEESKVILGARTAAGALHALRTLLQLETRGPDGALYWPCVRIWDAPVCPWRGTMLDVSRHFYSVNFLKRYLDELARLKMNVLHWHLTDDQGWRVEVKRYPQLTGVGAWRAGADSACYGGFYTQEQVREIVRYATDHGITVVPEIEFPGHCTAALAAYPYLGCRADTLDVPTHWGVFQDVYCVGQDATWAFLQDVLDELLPLFPSIWVHIGGDEVPKDRWRACAACQQRMKQEGLPDEDALQAWSIKRMQAYLQTKGKRLIGWDEILEGGLDSTAVVEVWRGDEQARKARGNGNRMIRTLYFNTSPADLKLEDVMRYDPRVDGSDALVMGAECPVWSEYSDERSIGYMVFPRLQVFAERLWTGGAPREDVRRRIASDVERLEREGWITAREDRDLFQAHIRYDPVRGDWLVTAELGRPDIAVEFRTRDTTGVFTDSLHVCRPGWISLGPTWNGQDLQNERAYRIESHLGLGATQRLSHPPDPKYGLDPEHGMSDGLLGTDDFHDGLWQGWQGQDLVITLDLGHTEEIRELSIRCLQAVTSWILLPLTVEFQFSDGTGHWRSITIVAHDVPVEPGGQLVHDFIMKLNRPILTRYVRASLVSQGKMPAWHLGAGGDSWIFADEFVVR
jgi:hexosaminidase